MKVDGGKMAGFAHVEFNEKNYGGGQKPTICTRDWQPSPRLIGKSRGIEYICGGNYFQSPADNMDGMLRQVADRRTV